MLQKVMSGAKTRKKPVKRLINECFESTFNAVFASVVVLRTSPVVVNKHEEGVGLWGQTIK